MISIFSSRVQSSIFSKQSLFVREFRKNALDVSIQKCLKSSIQLLKVGDLDLWESGFYNEMENRFKKFPKDVLQERKEQLQFLRERFPQIDATVKKEEYLDNSKGFFEILSFYDKLNVPDKLSFLAIDASRSIQTIKGCFVKKGEAFKLDNDKKIDRSLNNTYLEKLISKILPMVHQRGSFGFYVQIELVKETIRKDSSCCLIDVEDLKKKDNGYLALVMFDNTSVEGGNLEVLHPFQKEILFSSKIDFGMGVIFPSDSLLKIGFAPLRLRQIRGLKDAEVNFIRLKIRPLISIDS